jgi:hypothetical protein
MTDDPKAARWAAAQELRDNILFMAAAGMEMVFFDRDGSCDLPDYPNDGEGMLIPVTIGSRGNLSRAEAKRAAATWRQATGRFPKASFMVSLLGYNEDPREIWEFRDARRYVRWWARYAGMDDLATADRWLGLNSAIGRTMPTPWATAGIGFLAACGVFGEELRQAILRDHKPVVPQ